MKVYEADLRGDFKDDPKNANKGTQRGHGMLEKSVEQFGAARSMVVDANGIVVAGNKTREALINAGITNAVVVEVDGKTPVMVKRVDWDVNSDKGGRAREYAYADNRISEVDYLLDVEVIRDDLDKGVALSDFWSPADLHKIIDFDFSPATIDDQGALDKLDPKLTTCPHCGKSFEL
jgi:hypothetical protein